MAWLSLFLKGFATYDLVLILAALAAIGLSILGISLF
jgi:hypothetical protein